MEHNLKISVAKEPEQDGLVSCKTMSLKERLFTKLFGKKRKVVIIVPGDSIQEISICEKASEGGDRDAT